MIKKEKDYTFWQQIIAGFANRNARWYYSSHIDKIAMRYHDLTDKEKEEFKRVLKKLEQNKEDESN
jgi:predicted nucleic acid-binding OB-fold protein